MADKVPFNEKSEKINILGENCKIFIKCIKMGQKCTFSEKLEKVSRKLFTWTRLQLKLIIIHPYEKRRKN